MSERIDDNEIAAAGAKFAAARDKLKLKPDKATRRDGERKRASRKRPARTTGRTELFAFRARPDLKPTMEKIAAERSAEEGRRVPVAEVMEEALDAYIAARRKKHGAPR
jgi:hypothetical protein